MSILTLKQFRRWLQLTAILFLLNACSSSHDVPFNSKPVDIESATNLAQSIAHIANCGSFENNSFNEDIVFSCQMDINKKDALFNIHIFYDKSEKNRMASHLRLKREFASFKMGEYYIISKSVEDGIKNTAQDYLNFPGEMVMSLVK
ncbi:MAG: hypothetical protein QX191_06600 [Methylococcaceae bacterium]